MLYYSRAYLRVHPRERVWPGRGSCGVGGGVDGVAAVVLGEEVGPVPQQHVRHPGVLQEDGVELMGVQQSLQSQCGFQIVCWHLNVQIFRKIRGLGCVTRALVDA